jgi:enamine deaminase RidA (YjgF/YER057c/UK114 family)
MLTTKGGQEEMLKKHNPGGMAPAFSRYSLGVEAPPEVRWLFVSGQVGVGPNGALAEGPEAQMETAWRNILRILESAGMGRAIWSGSTLI